MQPLQPVSLGDFSSAFVVSPGTKANLKQRKPGYTAGCESKEEATSLLEKNKERIAELQNKLYSQKGKALLVVLQGMDTSGKDGTIRHVFGGINPQGVEVTSFKAPTEEELSHDFLWRIHKSVPPKGKIGVFNRSHYEDVLVPRVKNLVPENVWRARYDEINDFEKTLVENDVTVLKFFLNISKKEQKKRIISRIEDETKHWKLDEADIRDRKFWDDYFAAYEDAISNCSTEYARWHVIPSNRKWFRNLAISQIILETLEKMDLQYPEPSIDVSAIDIDKL